MPSPQIRLLLQPVSWLYGIGVGFRNILFNLGILKSEKYEVPVICVGNITVGGTGKTPHIEYLIELLSENYKVGVVSRGYKRKSKGYREVYMDSLPEEVGDEPLQIKKKFPHSFVVVDRNRRNAIRRMLSFGEGRRPDVILLDDGFQHRYVSPSMSILLVDSNRPVYEDKLLPAGYLREPLKAKDRASIVLVTKCPKDMKPIDRRIYEENLNLFVYQKIYFTSFDYGKLNPVFPEEETMVKLDLNKLKFKFIYLVTGIAQPQPLLEKMKEYSDNVEANFYPDHYFFKQSDIEKMTSDIKRISVSNENVIIVTTEKDATRLRTFSSTIDIELKKKFYYIPIEVIFDREEDQYIFNKKIIKHVRNYQTNG